MAETTAQNEMKTEKLLRVRGILIEEFDRYISQARAKTDDMDTMDILLDFEDTVFPAFADRLQKLYSKEKKLAALKESEEDVEEDD